MIRLRLRIALGCVALIVAFCGQSVVAQQICCIPLERPSPVETPAANDCCRSFDLLCPDLRPASCETYFSSEPACGRPSLYRGLNNLNPFAQQLTVEGYPVPGYSTDRREPTECQSAVSPTQGPPTAGFCFELLGELPVSAGLPCDK